jgi:hypothetical protein
LQRYDGDGIAALKGYAETLDSALLLALDVGRRLVYGLFQQAGGRCCALLRALHFDLLDDGAAVAVGRYNGCHAGLDVYCIISPGVLAGLKARRWRAAEWWGKLTMVPRTTSTPDMVVSV